MSEKDSYSVTMVYTETKVFTFAVGADSEEEAVTLAEKAIDHGFGDMAREKGSKTTRVCFATKEGQKNG